MSSIDVVQPVVGRFFSSFQVVRCSCEVEVPSGICGGRESLACDRTVWSSHLSRILSYEHGVVLLYSRSNP